MKVIDRLLGRGKGGSGEKGSRRESKASWTREDVELAMEEGPSALAAILVSLEPTDYFAPGDMGALVGGHSTPSRVFGPDGREASSGINATGRTAAYLVDFWKSGRMFDKLDDTVAITKRHADVSENSVTVKLETDEKDNRIGVGVYGGRNTSAYIFYLQDSSA